MTYADDTLVDRLAGYGRLFDHALVGRESTATATTFRFAARPGVGDWVLDLVRREAACCPFLSYEVDQAHGHGHESCGPPAASAPPTWPYSTTSSRGRAGRRRTRRSSPLGLSERGGIPVVVPIPER